jgi:hypothetical protein
MLGAPQRPFTDELLVRALREALTEGVRHGF